MFVITSLLHFLQQLKYRLSFIVLNSPPYSNRWSDAKASPQRRGVAFTVALSKASTGCLLLLITNSEASKHYCKYTQNY